MHPSTLIENSFYLFAQGASSLMLYLTFVQTTEKQIILILKHLTPQVHVNLPAVKRRADTLGTKRTVKQQWQVLKSSGAQLG